MNTTKQLYQWDINQMLVDCTGLYVDFPVNGEIYRVETKDGECLIPDEFLQVKGRQKIWECMPDCTRKEFVLEIKARPMPPDYAFTPTEQLTFDGLVKRVDDAIADMIRRADSGEFDGYTPVKGKDYFTADEIKQIQDEVSSGAVGDFKQTVDTVTDAFNINAANKVDAYDANAKEKLDAYNQNAESMLSAYNNNADSKIAEYNQNDTNKTAEYNSNAETKIDEYNTNANNRVAEFDSHTEQIQTDISGLKNDLTNVNNTKADKSELVKTNFYLDALWKLNNGISYQYETDSETAYQKTVPSGAKLCSLSKIGGKTLVWNQLCNPSNFENTVTRNGITYTNNRDGSISVSGTAEANSVFSFGYFDNVIGHKVLVIGCPEGGSENTFSINRGNGNIADVGNGRILTLEDYDTYFKIAVIQGATVDNLVFKPQIFDLTRMFGAGNEPATVEEFEAMFPNDYYPYNSGELMSFPMSEMVFVGRNIWDEQWEVGSINASNGNNNTVDTQIRSKNYIPVAPNEVCYICVGDKSYAKNIQGRFYDKDKNYIGYLDALGNQLSPNISFETPSNAYYFRFSLLSAYGNNYKNDIAIIKGEIGSYTPYKSYTITTPQAILDLDGYGVGINDTVYNYVDKENKLYHKRIGAVDLGTLTWVQSNYGANTYETAYFPSNHAEPINTLNVNGWATTGVPFSNMPDKTLRGITGNLSLLVIKDSAYTDVESFKAAMSSVILLYELAEEEIIDISDILDDEPFEVEAGGSLTFKNSNGDGYRVPIPTEEKYIISLAEVTV